MAGTSYDIVILSSSPPAPDVYAPSSPLYANNRPSPQRVAMRASPLATLSPPVGPQKKLSGASALASRKAAIPPDAIRGFATVGSLVRSEHFAQQPDNDSKETGHPQSRGASVQDAEQVTAKKKKAKKPSADNDEKPKPKSRARKPKADSNKPIRDPELRLPPPKTSPYFPKDDAEAPIEPSGEATEAAPKLTKSGKPRKPRAKKDRVEGGDADPKARKARTSKPKSQHEDAGAESAHFRTDADGIDDAVTREPTTLPTEADKIVETADASIWEVPEIPQLTRKKRTAKQRPGLVVESLDLDEAVSRRRDWTPPKDTVIASPFTDSVGKENKEFGPDNNAGHFMHMVSNFAYAQSPTARIPTNMSSSTTAEAAVTKRRRIELVDVPGNHSNSRNSSPEKGKAPKKKARTITDRATEQYQPRNVRLEPSSASSEFFQPRTTVTKLPLNDTAACTDNALPKKPPPKRSTSKSDPEKAASRPRTKKASAKSAAKPKTVAEKLLSPGSALTRMSKQDILFGTSSQLALEESPTLVRQIQQVMKESEQDGDGSAYQQLDPSLHWPRLKRAVGQRKLWAASSRDVEGGLLEQMEDVYIPEFDRTQDFPLLMDGVNDELGDAPDSFVNTDDLEIAPAVIISSDLPTPPRAPSPGSHTAHGASFQVQNHISKDLVFEDIDDFDSMPPPSNQNVELQDSFADIDDLLPPPAQSSTSAPPKPRPPAETTTTSSKKRSGRLVTPKSSALPDAASRVTQPKKQSAKTKAQSAKTKAQSVILPEKPATPPKASRRFIDIDEILDSEDEAMQALSPTPPRMRKLPDSQPLPLFTLSPTLAGKNKAATVDPTVVPVYRIVAANLDWSNLKSTVLTSITTHIRALPPTTNPSHPSWHEKILMYDPILLEDFTAHLNASTRIRSWRRATKAQIKAWNKEMKKSGQDEVFVRENGDEVLAIERDLEAWMVREWCESMSVCCIYGDRKPGGARKGLY